MLTNKHFIVALLVTPVLAIIAWFAVGMLIGERAAAPEAGESYPLVARSNCRYASGECTLANRDLELSITESVNVGAVLELESSHALDGAFMALTSVAEDGAPRAMQPMDEEGHSWQLYVGQSPAAEEQIRVAVTRKGSAFFAETGVAFLLPDSP